MQNKIVKPIYQQIAIDLASRIANGEFQEGSKISGRSTLAGQYNVSPETIRRAVSLLEDVNIVTVTHGSGILVESIENSFHFINQFKEVDSISAIKTEINEVLAEKEKLDIQLKKYIDRVLDYSVRFKNSNPFAPLEVELPEESFLIGKAIGEIAFWQNTGATIIAVKRGDELILSPGPYLIFNKGDNLLMVGDEESYDRVRRYLFDIER